jgi:hypothetical protein
MIDMNDKISFEERSKMAKELLLKQAPVTLEEAKEQVALLKSISSKKEKKK